MTTWRSYLKEDLLLVYLLFVGSERRLRLLYDSYSHYYFTENSHFLNLGYWKDSPATLDAACQALVNLVGKAGQFKASDVILDAGFGMGDQDISWIQQFSPARIVGLNIAPSQVDFARKQAAASQLEDRLDFRLGSATDMPFEPESFDKVVALESAFHFNTRERFLNEAFRVLRPHGRLVTADLIAMPRPASQTGKRVGLQRRVHKFIMRVSQKLMPTPLENICTKNGYAQKMKDAGFVNVRVETIREEVLPPFMNYLAVRLQDPEIKQRINPLMRRIFLTVAAKPDGMLSKMFVTTSDYIIATGDKPPSETV